MSIKYLYDKYDIPDGVLNNDEIIKTYELVDDDEIWYLLNFAYDKADEISPTGRRTPEQIDEIEQLKKELEEDMRQRQKEAEEDKAHSDSVQAWADTQRKKREDSVKREKIEKITRLQEALKNPKIKDLLLKVMNRKITPEQAFADIKANTDLKGKMMSLTYPTKYRGTRIGGKSRVFRRKNKKTTSTSRRNARRTQRHRKSSTRRSRRK